MSTPRDARSSSVAVRFLQQFLQDREQGRLRTLADYQEQFAADADIVAEEYSAVVAASGGDEGRIVYPADGQRYRRREQIGRGGMGVVYRAFDPTLDREVAMKVLGSGSDGLPDPRLLHRFLAEAKVIGRLQHPGIVAVHEIGLDDEHRPYFTMPLLAGRDLQAILGEARRGSPDWPLPRVVDVLVRVCEAVAHAHARGVLHRDLKPANVMVGDQGETWVVDWGLARDARGPSVAHAASPGGITDPRDDAEAPGQSCGRSLGQPTMAGEVLGTPAYMAPEQASGERASVGKHSDVYALGALLYHVLTGVAPYSDERTSPSSAVLLERLRTGPPSPVASLAPAVPPELAAICERAMARDPRDRYGSVDELGADLRAFRDGRVVRAYATGAIVELRKWMRRNRALGFAIAAAALALLIGFVVSATQKFAADHHAAVAAQNLDLAFDAAEQLLAKTALQDLENEPGADPVRRELGLKALAYYQRLRDLRGDDPRIAERIALSNYRLGVLASQLGRTDEALASLASARSAYERLLLPGGETGAATATDRRLACREKIVSIDMERLTILLQRGDVAAATAGLPRVIEELDGLRAVQPDSTTLLRAAGNARHNLALALMVAGDRAGALACAEEKLSVTRRLVEREGDEPWVHAQLGSAHQLRASVRMQLDRPDDAERDLRDGVAVLEAALVEHPDHRGLRARLGEVLNLLAVLLRQRERSDEAEQTLVRTVAVLRDLVTTNPGVRTYHGNLGGALVNLGMMTAMRGASAEAVPTLEQGLEQVRLALRIDPRASDYRDYRFIGGKELAIALLETDRHAEAAACVEELLRELPECPRWPAGRLLAACAKAAAADPGLPAAEAAALAAAHGERAVALLREALAAGQGRPAALADPVFDGLRERTDFQDLLPESGK